MLFFPPRRTCLATCAGSATEPFSQPEPKASGLKPLPQQSASLPWRRDLRRGVPVGGPSGPMLFFPPR
ncbi:hypothetical protein GLE_1075 [Lysobacter enzymogenes]|uniref:Uncharacterized protein n=1 Tax=Lysobacter enzymogenes TaxID=69 RepID=A0A0S2DD32_LYSEN|nr:hypothetical protein GLE_1075 [Lysobacter enzymogenes]